MSKWKIFVPILIVIVIGVFAWLQLADRSEGSTAVPEAVVETPVGEPAETGPAITGEEDLVDQADALVESLVGEYGEIESAAGDGSDAVGLDSQSDSEIFNVDYYAE